jgi:hypothetical protein
MSTAVIIIIIIIIRSTTITIMNTEPGPLNMWLGLIGIIVLASLIGWWRPFMTRDWLAFAGNVIGGFPIYKEAWKTSSKNLF